MDINEMIAAVKACGRGEQIAISGDGCYLPAVMRTVIAECDGRVEITAEGHSPRVRRVKDTEGLLRALRAACPPRDRVPVKYLTPSLFTDAVAVSDGVGAVFCPVYDYIDKTAWPQGGMDGMIGNSPYRYVMPEFYEPIPFAIAENGGAFMGRLASACKAYNTICNAKWSAPKAEEKFALVKIGVHFYNPNRVYSVMTALFKCGATRVTLRDGGKRYAPLIADTDVPRLYGMVMPIRTDYFTPCAWFDCGTDINVKAAMAA